MQCQRCGSRSAVERDGIPQPLRLFGDIEGCFCPQCILAIQAPYNDALRADIAARAPGLSAEDLAAVPDQMLKFTLCLPIPPAVT